MGAQNLPMETSRNLVGEVQGKLSPEKVVIVSGHIDSWDVGQGAMDDGGGAFISWMSLAVLRRLNLRPKRTVRLILRILYLPICIRNFTVHVMRK